MIEELMTNTFIEIQEKNDEYFLKSIDYDNNIQINLLSSILNDENNIKNIKSSNKIINFHNTEYFKENLKDIDIDEIEEEFKIIHEDYYEAINILEERIKKFKEKIENQIQLAKKIIEIYNLAIKSNRITYQIIINTKNILQFNPVEFFSDDYQINYDYNLLKTFSIDEIVDENLTIENIQKVIKIKVSQKDKLKERINIEDKISSLLFLEEMNKLICYNTNKIISFNILNFKKENEIKLNDNLISLNLTRDNNMYAGFSNSIKKLKFENNKIIIENYLDKIDLYIPGKIINYKNSIAWTDHNFIGFESKNYFDINDQLDVEWDDWSGYQMSMLIDIIEYKNDNIIYLYSLEFSDHHGEGGFNVHLGSFKNGKQIKLEDSDDELFSGCNRWYLKKNYKLLNDENNKIIVITVKTVFIINISKWEIIKKVSLLQNNINNSYCLNDKFFLFLFNNDPCLDAYNYRFAETLVKKEEKKNIIFYKIGENSEKVLYESKLKIEDNCDKLYYINVNNKNYIITYIPEYNLCEEITFYEIINMKNNKKLNIKI